MKKSEINDIFIPVADGLVVLSADEIIYLESNSNYTKIIMIEQIFIVSRSLKQFEEKLPKDSFIRIHNSYIINTKFIKSLFKGKPLSVTMKDGTELNIAESRREYFFEQLSKIAILF